MEQQNSSVEKMEAMKILGIMCAGKLGKEVYDIALRMNQQNRKWEKIVFVDNYAKKSNHYGVDVSHLKDWNEKKSSIEFIIATGEPQDRYEIYCQLQQNDFSITNVIDPTVIISPTAKLGKGIIIAPFSSISSDVCVDDNVLIQSNIRVGHDIKIGAHSVVSANCAIGGCTTIGKRSFLGMNATVKGDLTIGDSAIVSMGAVVFKNVEDGVVVAGNPARNTLGNAQHRVF